MGTSRAEALSISFLFPDCFQVVLSLLTYVGKHISEVYVQMSLGLTNHFLCYIGLLEKIERNQYKLFSL